jgi:hypothetical protein
MKSFFKFQLCYNSYIYTMLSYRIILKHTFICLLVSSLNAVSFLSAHAQSINLNDLIKLTSLSHAEADNFITTEKQFKVLAPISVYGKSISQYSKTLDNRGSELIIKNEWQDTDKIVHSSIHYDFRHKTYADTLIKQLENALYISKSKQIDNAKSVWLYESEKYIISIYTFANDKLPASIEIHEK